MQFCLVLLSALGQSIEDMSCLSEQIQFDSQDTVFLGTDVSQ